MTTRAAWLLAVLLAMPAFGGAQVPGPPSPVATPICDPAGCMPDMCGRHSPGCGYPEMTCVCQDPAKGCVGGFCRVTLAGRVRAWLGIERGAPLSFAVVAGSAGVTLAALAAGVWLLRRNRARNRD